MKGQAGSAVDGSRFSKIHVGLLTAVICSSALAMQSVAAQTDQPTAARTVDVVDHVFGNTLHDPYRWMEGEHNVEFQQWLTAQGAYTRSKLDALPTLKTWQQNLQKKSARPR